MSPHYPPINSKAFAWALLSQTIWLPLVAIDAHDRWQARVRSLQPASIAGAGAVSPNAHVPSLKEPGSAGEADAAGFSTGLLLGTAGHGPNPYLDGPIKDSIDVPKKTSNSAPHRPLGSGKLVYLDRPTIPTAGINLPTPAITRATLSTETDGFDPLMRSFTRSELLGGPLTLGDLNTSLMPPMAVAEQARWANSADPLAPLPQLWREPVRKALKTLPNSAAKITPAKVVHVPSSRVTKSTPVPLAMQDDGSVDILTKPVSPAVVEEIDSWSSRQKAPEPGSVAPTVVHLEPVPTSPLPEVVSGVSNPAEPVSWQREANSGSEPLPQVVSPGTTETQ